MDYDKLTKEELIGRLKSEEQARQALEARTKTAVEHDRVLHELQVHQLELEAQNQALREAQGQLEESRSRHVDLYDFAPIAYCTFDRDGVVLEINLTGASILGKERARIVGKPFLALVRLDNPDAFVRHIRNSMEATISVMSEISFSTERGPIEVQLVSAAVRNPLGACTSCRTAFLDITQRRAAEREARAAHEAEKALRGRIEAIDRASAAVSVALAKVSGPDIRDFLQVIVDQARQLTDAEYAALGIGGGQGQAFDPWVFSGMSAGLAATIGRTPKGVGLLGVVVHAGRPVRLRDLREHPGFSGFPAHHPPMTSMLGVPIPYLGQSRGNLYLANKQDGSEFTEEDQTVIEMLADRVGNAMEVARLRQVEAREHVRLEFLAKAGPVLAESIDYEATLGAISQLVVPVAADLSAVDLIEESGALRRVVVFHPDAAKQALLNRLVGPIPPDGFPEAVRTAIETAQAQYRDGKPEFLRSAIPEQEYRSILRELAVSSYLVAPMILRGRVVGVLRLAMAESGRKYTQADLPLAQEIAHHAALAIEGARLYRVAQTAVRARDAMLAVVSHDLRSYLSTTRISADLLSDAGPTGERRAGRKQVEAIKRSVTRMSKLIDNLRDATMIETGHFTIDPKTETVAKLVDEAVGLLEPQTAARSLQLKVQVAGQLSTVHCDRERVLQVISNLIGNAIKFTKKGGEIRIAATPAADSVIFSISDTGSGISEEHLAHVFDRYWTGRPGSSDGTGLGLFIAKAIVEAHGGRIWIESKVGVGSTVSFALPVAAPRADYASAVVATSESYLSSRR